MTARRMCKNSVSQHCFRRHPVAVRRSLNLQFLSDRRADSIRSRKAAYIYGHAFVLRSSSHDNLPCTLHRFHIYFLSNWCFSCHNRMTQRSTTLSCQQPWVYLRALPIAHVRLGVALLYSICKTSAVVIHEQGITRMVVVDFKP